MRNKDRNILPEAFFSSEFPVQVRTIVCRRAMAFEIVAWNRYLDRRNDREFSTNSRMGNGRWRIARRRIQIKRWKNIDAIYSCESFVLEEWLSLCSHRTRQRFQLYPSSVLAAFYFAAERSAVKLRRYNCVSRSERQKNLLPAYVSAFPYFSYNRLLKTRVRVSFTNRQQLIFGRKEIFLHRGNYSIGS